MPSISFIYKIGKNKKIYHGKYICNYILPEEHSGLDNEIKQLIIKGLNKYREIKKLHALKNKIIVGILSGPNNNYLDYSTILEYKCFDFYYDITKGYTQIFINGRLILTEY